jgi:hypothetical protein
MPPKNRKLPEGTIKLSVNLIPGTDEYVAYVSIRNKYQDEMSRRRKASSTVQLCKADLGNCEMVRGALFALDNVPPEELPNYIDSAWKQKGRHSLNNVIEQTEKQADSGTQLDDQAAVILH